MTWERLEGLLHADERAGAVDAQTIGELATRAASPGAAVGRVTSRGTELACAGPRDARREEPVDADTAFRWFSVTKPVVATCAMTLVEAGRLDLDAPVRQCLAYAPRGVTARQLLAHTSGLGNPLPLGWVRPAPSRRPLPSGDAWLASLVARARRSEPGVARYSNLGFLLVGALLERAADAPLDLLLERAVLAPLGMTATRLGPPRAPFAAGHQRRGLPSVLLAAVFGGARAYVAGQTREWLVLHPFELAGGAYGGLSGSIRDLLRFVAFHTMEDSPDAPRLLTSESLREMHSVQGRGPGIVTTLGFWRSGQASVHDGSAVGTRSAIHVDRARHRGAAVLVSSTRAPVAALARAASSLGDR